MQNAVRSTLALLALAGGQVFFAPTVSAADITSASPPAGMVSVLSSARARTQLVAISGGTSIVLVNGFVTPADLKALDSGQMSRGDRYMLIEQATPYAGRQFSKEKFAMIASQARTVDFLAQGKDSANAEMKQQKDSRPSEIRDLSVGDVGTGNVVIDTPTCIARSGRVVMAVKGAQVTERMIVAFVYSNGQIYTTSGYAHDTAADTQWLTTNFLSWLRGICAA